MVMPRTFCFSAALAALALASAFLYSMRTLIVRSPPKRGEKTTDDHGIFLLDHLASKLDARSGAARYNSYSVFSVFFGKLFPVHDRLSITNIPSPLVF